MLYRKIGRRYVPVGPEATSWFPASGIWLVDVQPHKTVQQCILRLGELPALYPYANLARHTETIARVIADTRTQGLSALEVALEILKEIARLETKGDMK